MGIFEKRTYDDTKRAKEQAESVKNEVNREYESKYSESLVRNYAGGIGLNSTSIHTRSDLNKFVNDIVMTDPLLTGFSFYIDFDTSPLFKDLYLFERIDDYTDKSRIVSSKLASLCDGYNNSFGNNFMEKIQKKLVGPILGKRERELYVEPYGAIEYLYLSDMVYVSGSKDKAAEPQIVNSKADEYDQIIRNLNNEIKRLVALRDDTLDLVSLYQIKQAEVSISGITDTLDVLSETRDLRAAASAVPPEQYSMYKARIESAKNEVVALDNRIEELKKELKIYTELKQQEENKAANTKSLLSGTPKMNDGQVLSSPNSVMNLIRFYQTIKNINDNRQYVITSVEGMQDIFNAAYNLSGEMKNELTLKLLEDVKMTITRMLMSYNEAVMDTKYKREKIPSNLRKFNMSLFVYDFRSFRNNRSMIGKSLIDFMNKTTDRRANINGVDEDFNDYVLKLLSEHISVVEVYLTGCKIIETGFDGLHDINTTVKSEGAQCSLRLTYDTADVNPVMFADVDNLFNIIQNK